MCAIALVVAMLRVQAMGMPAEYVDGGGDAQLLRLDGAPALPLDAPLIDLVRYDIGAWTPNNPMDSLFRGQWTQAPADFFRLDLVFAGLVNPPGLGFPANIFFYGDNPLLGFVEFDIDANVMTGGELIGPQFRYQGAAARFGGLPEAARYADKMSLDSCPGSNDADISTGPYFPERSGEEFNLAFLWGSVSSLDVGSNGDLFFDPGEVWLVRGPFLNRAHGFDDFILICCSNGLPTYVPQVELLFSHSIATDQTTVSLVYPLTQDGAAAITGVAPEPSDCCADNQNSIQEGMDHVVLSTQFASAADRSSANFPLIEGWEFSIPGDFLDPVTWELNAIFVSVFIDPDTLAPALAWADTAPNVLMHDYNGDSAVDSDDIALFDAFLAAEDGGACDADGVADGIYTIIDFGNGFDIHDANYDGIVNADDRPVEISTMAFFDMDNDGDLDLADFAILQRCIQLGGGPGVSPACDNLDTNSDGTVTPIEVIPFSELMGGPGNIIFIEDGLVIP